jgi:hypothetical protein
LLVAGLCLAALIAALCWRIGAKDPPLDPDALRRIRRHADRSLREQNFPNE